MHVKNWHVDVFLSEEGDVTEARAVLSSDRERVLTGTGSAFRNPHDRDVPEIGDEVAVSRALAALSTNLLDVAYRDMDATVDDTFRAG